MPRLNECETTNYGFRHAKRIRFFFGIILFLFGLIAIELQADAGGDWSDLFIPSGIVPNLTATSRSSTVTFPTVKLRRKNLFAIMALSGQQFNLGVRHYQIGSYQTYGTWELRTKDMTVLDSGTLNFDTDDTISYTHDKNEILFLCIDSGPNGYYITSSNASVGLYSGVSTNFFSSSNDGKELYIYVPDKVKNVSITLTSPNSNELVKAEIYNPEEILAAQGETTVSESEVTVTATVGTYDDDVWTIKICDPSSGHLEDFVMKINSAVAPVLTLISQDEFYYVPFGAQNKLSILVDKVIAASASYVHAAWMLEEVAAAGFNTYVTRQYNNDGSEYVSNITNLENLAELCEDAELNTLVWMRGTKSVSLSNQDYDGKRYLPGTAEAELLSPNSDELWTHLTYYVSQYANLSKTCPSIKGVFFDFEDYSSSSPYNHAYHISYDDVITVKYETARSITIPVDPEERKAWLISNDYHDDFVSFQIAHWRERCSQLRADIDAINPQFQFFFYPFSDLDESPFLYGEDAPVARFASAQAPVCLADTSCYSPPYRNSLIHDAEPIAWEVENQVNARNSLAEELGVPYLQFPGFLPAYADYNLEVLARAPIAAAEVGNGFWVFYSQYTYSQEEDSEHVQIMDYLTWSNSKIAVSDYNAANTTFESCLPWGSFWDPADTVPNFSGAIDHTNKSFSSCRLRIQAPIAISCEAGESVSLGIAVQQVGSYTDQVGWEIRNANDMESSVARGTIWLEDETDTISFTPEETGIYFLIIASWLNTANISSANAPIAFYAGKPVHFMRNTTPLYINVPDGVTSFSLTAKGTGGEHVKVSIYSPADQLVEQDQTSPAIPEKTLTVNVGGHGPGIWKVVTAATGTDTFEDFFLSLGTEIPQLFSLASDAVFFRKLDFEAENGTLVSPMTAHDDGDCYGGQYVSSNTGGQGTVTFQFAVPENGTYYLWGRLWEPDGNHDSFFVYTDGDNTSSGADEYIWDISTGPESEWKWLRLKSRTQNPRTFSWNSGTHTLIFRTREPQSQLDKIIITKDPNFNPSD